MRSAIYRLNKSSLHLAEIGFVDPVFGKKNFKNKYGRKKVCGPEFFQSSHSLGMSPAIKMEIRVRVTEFSK